MEEEANAYENVCSWGYSFPTHPCHFSSVHAENGSSFNTLSPPPPVHLGKGRTQHPCLSTGYCVCLGSALWLVLPHVIAETKGKEGLGLTTQLTRDERLPLKVFLSNQSLRKTVLWLNTSFLGELALACLLCP